MGCPLYRRRSARGSVIKPMSSTANALGDVPWYLPVGDGACSNIGSGSTTDQTMGLTIGTSAALRVITRQPLSRTTSRTPAGRLVIIVRQSDNHWSMHLGADARQVVVGQWPYASR